MCQNGFQITTGTFKYIGYSNSQLKSHSCWYLLEKDGVLQEDQVINEMGNFDKETKILKRYARRGQIFSTTQYVSDMRDDQINRKYPDIERGEFCFSDGCGNINPALAIKAARFYGLKKCSAI